MKLRNLLLTSLLSISGLASAAPTTSQFVASNFGTMGTMSGSITWEDTAVGGVGVLVSSEILSWSFTSFATGVTIAKTDGGGLVPTSFPGLTVMGTDLLIPAVDTTFGFRNAGFSSVSFGTISQPTNLQLAGSFSPFGGSGFTFVNYSPLNQPILMFSVPDGEPAQGAVPAPGALALLGVGLLAWRAARAARKA